MVTTEKKRRRKTPLDEMGSFMRVSEIETNLTHVTMLAILDLRSPNEKGGPNRESLSKEELVERYDSELLPRYLRMRSKMVDDAVLVELPGFSSRRVIHEVDVPWPHDHKALERTIARLTTRPFDPNLPQWDVYLLRGWMGDREMGEGGEPIVATKTPSIDQLEPTVARPPFQAIYNRWHHSMGDGASLGYSYSVLCDGGPQPPPTDLVKRAECYARRSMGARVFGTLWLLLGTLLVFVKWAYLVWAVPPPPSGMFDQKGLSRHKHVAWSRFVFRVDDAQRVCKRLKPVDGRAPTMNDLVLSCVAGSVERCLKKHVASGVRAGQELAIGLPVSMRTEVEAKEMASMLGSYAVLLPVDSGKFRRPLIDRLHEVSRRMSWNKRLPEPHVANFLSWVFAKLPSFVTLPIFNQMSKSATAVVSNVRGPDTLAQLYDRDVFSMIPFVPPPNHVRLGFMFTTYGGHAELAVTADNTLNFPPFELVKAFGEEFSELRDLASAIEAQGPTLQR